MESAYCLCRARLQGQGTLTDEHQQHLGGEKSHRGLQTTWISCTHVCSCLRRKLEEAGGAHGCSVCLGEEGFSAPPIVWLFPTKDLAVVNTMMGGCRGSSVSSRLRNGRGKRQSMAGFGCGCSQKKPYPSPLPTLDSRSLRLICAKVKFCLHFFCQVYVYEILILLPVIWTTSVSLVWLLPGLLSHCRCMGAGHWIRAQESIPRFALSGRWLSLSQMPSFPDTWHGYGSPISEIAHDMCPVFFCSLRELIQPPKSLHCNKLPNLSHILKSKFWAAYINYWIQFAALF